MTGSVCVPVKSIASDIGSSQSLYQLICDYDPSEVPFFVKNRFVLSLNRCEVKNFLFAARVM